MFEKLIRLKCDADRRARELCNFDIPIALLDSVPMDAEKGWWACRAYLISNDLDRQGTEFPLLEALKMRRN